MDEKIRRVARAATESEKSIERHLVKRVAEMGGLALKYSSTTMAGYPDRLVLLPGGVAQWVELKSKGQKPTARQLIRFASLAQVGHPVVVCDSIEKVDRLLEVLGS